MNRAWVSVRCVLLVLVGVSALSCRAEEGVPLSGTGVEVQSRMLMEFAPFIESMMADLAIPGLGIAVVREGEVVYEEVFGVGSVEGGEELSIHSIFHMASVTKTFTATAIMQLAEQGLIDIDEPLVKYLPYFVLQDERYSQITVRHALSHISGMPDYDSDPWSNPSYDEGALERFTREFVSQKGMTSDPGEEYQYNNNLFEVLGDLVAKVSGQPFSAYVKERILDPLGMDQSTLLLEEVDPNLLTTPHVFRDGLAEVGEVFPYNRMHGPSSTLLSSIHEMSHWLLANLSMGEFRGSSILSGETLEAMWTPAGEGYEHVGLCWHLGELVGMRSVSHGGSDLGFRSHLLLLPDQRTGVVVASNFSRTPAREIAEKAARVALGTEG